MCEYKIIHSDMIKQSLTRIRTLESEIFVQSLFNEPHSIILNFSHEIEPCYFSLCQLKYKYKFSLEYNQLIIESDRKCSFSLRILKKIQPVFKLLANIDKGLILNEPQVLLANKQDNVIYLGNKLIDNMLLPDVSFPFISFVLISIILFFFLQFHVTLFCTSRRFKKSNINIKNK